MEEVNQSSKIFSYMRFVYLLFFLIFVLSLFTPYARIGVHSWAFTLHIATLLYFTGIAGLILILISIIFVFKLKFEQSLKLGVIGDVIVGINIVYVAHVIFIIFEYVIPEIGFYLSLISFIGMCAMNFVIYTNREIIKQRALGQEEKSYEPITADVILYCPRCKTKVKGDSNSCDLCHQDFNEFPAITREEKSFRYCPNCQKNVKPKKKFSAVYWIVVPLMSIVLFMFFGFMVIILTVVLFLVAALSKPRCSNCKKKTESPRFLQPRSTPQIQERASIPDSVNVCSNCGNKVKPSINKFCEYCGQPLSK